MRIARSALFCIAASSLPTHVPADTFYAASVRTQANAAATEVSAGILYVIEPATAAASVVAPIRVDGQASIGVTGLAVHPKTGVFYGITGSFSPEYRHWLVTINPVSGNAKLVGPLGDVGSDIGFSPDGTLYTWLPESSRLATVDIATGAVTAKGPSGIRSATMGGGLAIRSDQSGYVAATGATGTLDSIDLRTGQVTPGPALIGAPYPSAITNLSFAPSGRLYAVNSNSGAPAATALVSISPQSGKVEPVGPLPADIEALIWDVGRGPAVKSGIERSTISLLLALAAVAGAIAAMVLMARR